MGKTRLALRVAASVAASYADGVWLVDLAPLVDAADVSRAVALAAQVQEQPDRVVIDVLVDVLGRKELLFCYWITAST